jgi:hypothetical protein
LGERFLGIGLSQSGGGGQGEHHSGDANGFGHDVFPSPKEMRFESRLLKPFRFAGRLCFPRMLGFDVGFQVVQARGPEHPVLLDPGVDGAERIGIELVNAVTAFAVFADQVRAAQQTQVFGDGGNLSGRLAASAQEVQDRAAGGIGKGLEGGFR